MALVLAKICINVYKKKCIYMYSFMVIQGDVANIQQDVFNKYECPGGNGSKHLFRTFFFFFGIKVLIQMPFQRVSLIAQA